MIFSSVNVNTRTIFLGNFDIVTVTVTLTGFNTTKEIILFVLVLLILKYLSANDSWFE